MKLELLREAKAAAWAEGDTRALVLRLWREWLGPHRGTLALILALTVVIACTTGLYPILIKAAFEAFTNRSGTGAPIKINLIVRRFVLDRESAILLAPVFVVVVTTIKGFALYATTVLTNRVVTRVEADMQSALYAHLIDADLAQLGRESAASLTQRFTTDFAFIREALTRLSTVFLREIATVTALVVAMIAIDPVLTLIAAVAAPFFARPVARIGKKLRRNASSSQEQIGRMAGLVSESLAGARIAKTFGLEAYLKERTRSTFEEIRRLKMKSANARARLDPLLEAGGGIAVALVLSFIGWRILDGRSTVGDFAGFITALIMAAQPVRALGNLNAILQEAAAALKRYFAILDEEPEIRNRPNAKPLAVRGGEIRFEKVSFAYREGQAAVEAIDLVVPAGRTTALVGRSGSGKSTLLSLVPRLYDPSAGRVLIDGQDVRDVTLESLRAAVAVVSQDVVLFDDTLRANIGFGRAGASEAEVVAAARAAAAHDFIMALPDGYDTRVGPGGAGLSGGERQRVSLARAFLKNAPILLLDEPTSALDAEAEMQVQEALQHLMRGRTTLVIAHRLSTIRDADLIVVMDGGRIVETGTHGALGAGSGIYARLQRLQLSGDGLAIPGG
ncbi:ATP-binding cassette domain-containing protein [Enterovirga aerilata]|uniref:ABC transporter ATP-binding protein n=1 Tax=Enterovirga aerilata TaxID=2730920 RepID=A0A849I6L2_9HYPH|nr:ABC transporter ATP-binding protein [Enterovirga sp. DB1703]